MIMQKETKETKETKNTVNEISIGISPETHSALERVAQRKDLPLKALLKFYIGQGLRGDLSEEEAKDLALKRLKSRRASKETAETDLAA